MININSDSLPPIFDQVVSHFGDRAAGPSTREDIVNALFTAIINAAADNARKILRISHVKREENVKKEEEVYPALQTSDRLSGVNLSRAQLVEQIQMVVPLSTQILEIALLLIESQIDLRLKGAKDFNLSGIHFSLNIRKAGDIASWCQSILPSILQGAAADRPTIWQRLSRHRPEGIRILVEGLPLAATLREAVPYKIEVENFVLDRLMVRNDEDHRIRLLHISDLHMVQEIAEPGRKLRIPYGVATHRRETTKSLASKLRDLRPRYDLVLATGDLTTNGACGAFETVLKYIQRGALSRENEKRMYMFGLSAGVGARLLVPGNHDRYGEDKLLPGQRKSSIFEEVLKTPKAYPYVVGYRPPRRYAEPESLTLLFFVFDSNLPECPKKMGAKARAKAIANGEIDSDEIKHASYIAKEIMRSKKVEDLYGKFLEFTPEKTVRIAVLHHHPFVSAEAEKDAQDKKWYLFHPIKTIKQEFRQIESNLMKLENADKFIEGCFHMGIQLVLFGHLHVPYYRIVMVKASGADMKKFAEIDTPFGTMPLVIHGFCCASTMVSTVSENGFYLFDFYDEKKVSVDFYSSKTEDKKQSGPFIRVSEKCRDIDLSNPDVSDSDVKDVFLQY